MKAYTPAERRKRRLANSKGARAAQVTRARNRRWKEIAKEQGERWLIEQVQHLKAHRRLPTEALDRAMTDARLAAFFREARAASEATLRTHLAAKGARTWDRVARPAQTKAQKEVERQEGLDRMWARLWGNVTVGQEWNEEEDRWESISELDPEEADFSAAENGPYLREVTRQMKVEEDRVRDEWKRTKQLLNQEPIGPAEGTPEVQPSLAPEEMEAIRAKRAVRARAHKEEQRRISDAIWEEIEAMSEEEIEALATRRHRRTKAEIEAAAAERMPWEDD